MNAEQIQHICQIAIAVGAIIAAIGTYGNFYYGKKKVNEIPVQNKIEKLLISDNDAPIQVNVGSPNSQQIINNKRVIKNEVLREKGKRGNFHILRLTFQQTDGIWDVGTKFWMQLQLSGPYQKYEFISGYPPTLPLSNVRTTSGVPEAAKKGWIELETTTPPLNEPIILEIESTSDVDAEKILLQPAIEYKNG